MKIQSTITQRPLSRMKRGFSLFEMVIVMGIIGLILGGAIFSMGKIKNSAAISAADADMKAFDSNLEQYNNIGGDYPSKSQGLEALLVRPTSAPRPRRWTQTLKDENDLLDPWGTKYRYERVGSKDKSRPEVFSAGPDATWDTDDDMGSQD